MTRTSTAWFAGSVALTILGMALVAPVPPVGSVMLVAGVTSLMLFLLFAYRVATTTNDQWVWQTPHKPRREHLAEEAAKHLAEQRAESGETPTDAAG